jgi:hypothetical protein
MYLGLETRLEPLLSSSCPHHALVSLIPIPNPCRDLLDNHDHPCCCCISYCCCQFKETIYKDSLRHVPGAWESRRVWALAFVVVPSSLWFPFPTLVVIFLIVVIVLVVVVLVVVVVALLSVQSPRSSCDLVDLHFENIIRLSLYSTTTSSPSQDV